MRLPAMRRIVDRGSTPRPIGDEQTRTGVGNLIDPVKLDPPVAFVKQIEQGARPAQHDFVHTELIDFSGALAHSQRAHTTLDLLDECHPVDLLDGSPLSRGKTDPNFSAKSVERFSKISAQHV